MNHSFHDSILHCKDFSMAIHNRIRDVVRRTVIASAIYRQNAVAYFIELSAIRVR